MSTYRVTLYAEGTEEDALSLKKSLAQSINDEYSLKSVFSVSVDLDDPPDDLSDRVMALCMVELEMGLDRKQLDQLMHELPEGRKYMPIEFHENNTSAYGFIDSEYYEEHGYKTDCFSEQINAILDDMRLESSDGRYRTPDGRLFYMGYFSD
jgi:hypothetical protein